VFTSPVGSITEIQHESPCDHFVSILALNKPYVRSREVSTEQIKKDILQRRNDVNEGNTRGFQKKGGRFLSPVRLPVPPSPQKL